MAGAIAAFILIAVTYQQLNIYGKALAMAGILLAGVMYAFAFLGFMGAWQRSKPALFLAGVLCTILLLALVACLVAIHWLNGELDKNTLVVTLERLWTENVQTHPATICRFQQEARCTGFRANCFLRMTSQCPVVCPLRPLAC